MPTYYRYRIGGNDESDLSYPIGSWENPRPYAAHNFHDSGPTRPEPAAVQLNDQAQVSRWQDGGIQIHHSIQTTAASRWQEGGMQTHRRTHTTTGSGWQQRQLQTYSPNHVPSNGRVAPSNAARNSSGEWRPVPTPVTLARNPPKPSDRQTVQAYWSYDSPLVHSALTSPPKIHFSSSTASLSVVTLPPRSTFDYLQPPYFLPSHPPPPPLYGICHIDTSGFYSHSPPCNHVVSHPEANSISRSKSVPRAQSPPDHTLVPLPPCASPPPKISHQPRPDCLRRPTLSTPPVTPYPYRRPLTRTPSPPPRRQSRQFSYQLPTAERYEAEDLLLHRAPDEPCDLCGMPGGQRYQGLIFCWRCLRDARETERQHEESRKEVDREHGESIKQRRGSKGRRVSFVE